MNPTSPNIPSSGQDSPLADRPIIKDFAASLRVRYCECDPMGVAHHASYVPWLEIGRTELLRQSGISYAALEEQGILLVIVKMEVRYRKPVRYDDLLQIRTLWTGGSRVKIEHSYEVLVLEPGTPAPSSEPFTPYVAAAATTVLGCVGRGGGIQLLPDWLVSERSSPQAFKL